MAFELTAQRPRRVARVRECVDLPKGLLGNLQAGALRVPERGRFNVLPILAVLRLITSSYLVGA
jgi:hypothetical protein